MTGAEDSTINEIPERSAPITPGNAIIATGAVLAVLLGIPCIFIGLFGVVGLVTGQKIVAGGCGAAWGYLAVAGAYELNRRKFDWHKGRRYSDLHLLGGTVAVALGFVIGGAIHETMPVVAFVPALSAVVQADNAGRNRLLPLVHVSVLATGAAIGIWFYRNGIVGQVLLERLAALP